LLLPSLPPSSRKKKKKEKEKEKKYIRIIYTTCCVFMSTPESQHPNPGCEWYHPTTISGLQYQTKQKQYEVEKRNI
jgi:hypothetical protein